MIELIIGVGVTGASQPVYFQQQPQLQTVQNDKKVFIIGIETYSTLHIAGSPITSGNPVATPAQLLNAVLVLNVMGTLDYQLLPLTKLVSQFVDANAALSAAGTNNSHSEGVFLFEDLWEVDWTKSYVQTVNVPAGQPYSYLFGVYYNWDQPLR